MPNYGVQYVSEVIDINVNHTTVVLQTGPLDGAPYLTLKLTIRTL